MASSFQVIKRQLEGEILSLKKKLDSKDDEAENESFERLKFNEGSFWMSKLNIIYIIYIIYIKYIKYIKYIIYVIFVI